VQADTAPRSGIGAKIGLCNVLRLEAHFGKVAARLTRRALGGKAMGTDFAALIDTKGLTERVGTALDLLEQYPTRIALERMGVRVPHAFASSDIPGENLEYSEWGWTWRYVYVQSNELNPRPVLPNLGIPLCLPEGWKLRFGIDVIEVSRTGPRWGSFLRSSSKERRSLFIEPLLALCEIFDATDCLVAPDDHPIFSAFSDGLSFEEIIAPENPGQIANLDDAVNGSSEPPSPVDCWRLPLPWISA
jgi:hypothetical protein